MIMKDSIVKTEPGCKPIMSRAKRKQKEDRMRVLSICIAVEKLFHSRKMALMSKEHKEIAMDLYEDNKEMIDQLRANGGRA